MLRSLCESIEVRRLKYILYAFSFYSFDNDIYVCFVISNFEVEASSLSFGMENMLKLGPKMVALSFDEGRNFEKSVKDGKKGQSK